MTLYRLFFSLGVITVLSGCCLPINGPSPIEGVPRSESSSGAQPLFDLSLDLKKIVLTPQDMTGVFPRTYALSQKIEGEGRKGLVTTYQTESIPHTLAFAKGYSTRIEIHREIAAAREAYGREISEETGVRIPLGTIGDESQARVGDIDTPEGFSVPGKKYSILFRQGNAVVSVLIKINRELPSEKLEYWGRLISDRLASVPQR